MKSNDYNIILKISANHVFKSNVALYVGNKNKSTFLSKGKTSWKTAMRRSVYTQSQMIGSN